MRYVNHPLVLCIHRVYEDLDHIHLVLDHVPGGELFSRIIKRGKFCEQNAAQFASNLLQALDYLHTNGIVHRDLKPENILMTSETDDTVFQIADFGLATFISNEVLSLRCGSPGYVAPEILKNKSYGTKVDIFSAGIVMYILLSGRAPFPGRAPDEILQRNKEAKIYF
jgi:serine/threonine protein kinase